MESFCDGKKIDQTQYLVSDSYIQTLYVVKWFCVNFYKESHQSHEVRTLFLCKQFSRKTPCILGYFFCDKNREVRAGFMYEKCCFLRASFHNKFRLFNGGQGRSECLHRWLSEFLYASHLSESRELVWILLGLFGYILSTHHTVLAVLLLDQVEN